MSLVSRLAAKPHVQCKEHRNFPVYFTCPKFSIHLEHFETLFALEFAEALGVVDEVVPEAFLDHVRGEPCSIASLGLWNLEWWRGSRNCHPFSLCGAQT